MRLKSRSSAFSLSIPTKRELADAAMEISERDMAIRQLHERFCWLDVPMSRVFRALSGD